MAVTTNKVSTTPTSTNKTNTSTTTNSTSSNKSSWLKYINSNASSLQKWILQYWSIDWLEKALNAKWYTIKWTVSQATSWNTVNTWTSWSTTSTTWNKVNTTWTSWLSWWSWINNETKKLTTEQAVQKEQIDNLKKESTNKTNFVIWQWSDAEYKMKANNIDLVSDKVNDLYSKSTDKVKALNAINERLSKKNQMFDEKTWKIVSKNLSLWTWNSPVLDAANKNIELYKENAEKSANQKKEIIDDTAKKSSELEIKKDKEKEDRLQSRFDEFNKVLSNYRKEAEDRKAEIDNTLNQQKLVQQRNANAAAAIAWQWPWVSEWEQMQVAADMASRAASNIAEAELTATQNKLNIDNQLKQAWIEEWSARDYLNNNLNMFTDEQYKYFLDALQQNWWNYLKAIQQTEDLVWSLVNQWTSETYNRVLKSQRIQQNNEEFNSWDLEKKSILVLEALKDIWSSYSDTQAIKNYIKTTWWTYSDIVSHFDKENQTKVDKIQQALTTLPIAIQTAYLNNKEVKDWLDSLLSK